LATVNLELASSKPSPQLNEMPDPKRKSPKKENSHQSKSVPVLEVKQLDWKTRASNIWLLWKSKRLPAKD
jgi:hypothetical protein